MLYVSICMIWQWNSFFVETTQATERERGKENEQNEVKKRSRYAERDRVWISDAIEYDNTQIQLMVSAMKWISTRTSSSFFLSFLFFVVQIAAKSWNHRFLCDAYKFDLLRFDLRFFSVLRFWMPGGLSTILLRMNLCTVEFSFIPGQSEAKTDRERMRLLCGTPGEWHSNQRLNNFCAAIYRISWLQTLFFLYHIKPFNIRNCERASAHSRFQLNSVYCIPNILQH